MRPKGERSLAKRRLSRGGCVFSRPGGRALSQSLTPGFLFTQHYQVTVVDLKFCYRGPMSFAYVCNGFFPLPSPCFFPAGLMQ